MKKSIYQKKRIAVLVSLISLSSAVIATNAFAGNFYLGGGLGYSGLSTPSGDAFTASPTDGSTTYSETSSSTDIGGLGATAFAGYNFNENFAVELGYTSYANSDYKSSQNEYNGSGSLTGTSSASLSYSTYTYDMFARGNLPITDKFSVFAKAGVSYVTQEVDYTNSNTGTAPSMPINSSSFTTPKAGDNTYTAFRPAGAIGFNFNLTDMLAAQVFTQGFLGSGDFDSDQDAIASGYLVGAGISFTFA